VGYSHSVTPLAPQAHVTDPVELATAEDLRLFLEYVERSISEKMNRQSAAVKDLLLEGYGNITVMLKVKKGQLVVADVLIGTTYDLEKERLRNRG
jgi:hypothetical protein